MNTWRKPQPEMSGEEEEPFWTPEPVIGYRGWEWSGRYLSGAYIEWKSAKLVGEHHNDPNKHPSPQWDCLCGVNTYKDPLSARNFPVLGKIALTGNVIEFEHGYRGQYGEILELAIDERYLEEKDLPQILQDIYGVPAERRDRIPWRK